MTSMDNPIPLHIVHENGHLQIVKYLFGKGANIEPKERHIFPEKSS